MKLPGLATFSALMLAVVLTVWLGIAGPVSLEAVKGWQTLIAAGVALVAAIIAWFAAMAKIKFDERVLAGESRRKALAVLFQTDLAVGELRDRARLVEGELDEALNNPVFTHLRPEHVRIEEPKEFEAIWNDLDIFPRAIIAQLASIRRYVRTIKTLLSESPRDQSFIGALNVTNVADFVSELADDCDELIEQLEPLISNLTTES